MCAIKYSNIFDVMLPARSYASRLALYLPLITSHIKATRTFNSGTLKHKRRPHFNEKQRHREEKTTGSSVQTSELPVPPPGALPPCGPSLYHVCYHVCANPSTRNRLGVLISPSLEFRPWEAL